MHRWQIKAVRYLPLILSLVPLLIPSHAQADVLQVAPDGTIAWLRRTHAVGWEAKPTTPAKPAPGTPPAYAAVTASAAAANGISPALLEALIWQESRWHASARSPKGAVGLGQLMPATARAMGVDPADPQANIRASARYLRQQIDRFGGDIELALAAYNAGPGRVMRAGAVPAIPETQGYVRAITDHLNTALTASPQGDRPHVRP